jgi:hypothetical protein
MTILVFPIGLALSIYNKNWVVVPGYGSGAYNKTEERQALGKPENNTVLLRQELSMHNTTSVLHFSQIN